MQPDLPGIDWRNYEIPCVMVSNLWGGPPQAMFLRKHTELLPWDS